MSALIVCYFCLDFRRCLEGVFEVRATSGNTHLGGEDFDQRIMKYCMSQVGFNAGRVTLLEGISFPFLLLAFLSF